MSIPKLTSKAVFDFVLRTLMLKKVPYVSGPPGIGKSAVMHQVAEHANLKMIDMRLSQMLSEDLTGIPERDQERGKAIYLPFDTIPLEGDKIPDGYSGWLLFLDELSSAQEEIWAASYSLLWDRMVGGKKLHPRCLVAAAGNRASDSAIARELPDTLIRRVKAIEMECSAADWLDWAKGANQNQSVVSYIENNTNALYAPTDKNQRDELEAYPCPSGWTDACDYMDQFEKIQSKNMEVRRDSAGIPIPGTQNRSGIDDLTFSLISSCVGKMAAKAFSEAYDADIMLPYPWEIAQSPNSARIPQTSAQKVELLKTLADFFMESQDQSRENLLSYVNRMGGEYCEMYAHLMEQKLGTTPSDMKLLESIQKRLNIQLAG